MARLAVTGSPAERSMVVKLAIGILEYLSDRRRRSDGVLIAKLGVAAEQTVGDPFAAAILPFDLAQQYGAAGLYSLAIEQMRTALAAPKMVECQAQYRYGQIYLGEFLVQLGRYDEAISSAGLGVADALRRGDEIGEAEGRLILGIVAGRQGRTAAQDQEFDRAVEVMRRMGSKIERHWILCGIGISYREAGRPDKSTAYFQECLVAALANDDQIEIAEAHEGLGRAELERGALDLAERHLLAALETMRGTWLSEAQIRKHLGRVLQSDGRPEEAVAQWQAALELLVRHGAPQAGELRSLLAGHQ